jgi:formamidopyrimidine-DNA glycosylase
MPEHPDIEVYLEALRPRIGGQPLEVARVSSPFLLRTVEPALESFLGRRVEALRRLGKRIVIGFAGERFMVLHLMVTGRLQWKPRGAKGAGRIGLAAFDFPPGTLLLTRRVQKSGPRSIWLRERRRSRPSIPAAWRCWRRISRPSRRRSRRRATP